MPGGAPSAPDRSLGRRSSLPAGRAIVGATLVIVAAVLTFVGYVLATAKPTQKYLVATVPIAPNQPLTAAQFTPVDGDLPPEVRRTVFQSFDQIKDGVLLTKLEAGALVTTSDVVARSAAESRYAVPFSAPAWKLHDVKQGDTVVLIPTAERSGPQRPESLKVRILSLTSTGGTNGDQIVMAAADSQKDIQDLVDVVGDGKFWIARETGAGAAGGAPATGGPLGGTPAPATTAPAPTSTAAPAPGGGPATTARRP
jgi:hypothetical protein